MTAGGAGLYPMAATAAIAFIVWGSLFPFTFHLVSFTEAGGLLWRTRDFVFDVAAWSLTDIASNALLFIPMGIFVSATLERTRLVRHSFLRVVGLGFLLSVAVEFGQGFVRWRTPSLLDVTSAALGAGVGFFVWRVARGSIDAAIAVLGRTWRSSTRVERTLLIYGALFACAWLVPFDVTIRPNEVLDKYQHQRLILPFRYSPDAATRLELVVTFVAAVPLGVIARVCGSSAGTWRSLPHAMALATLWLLALEVAQVPVFSRTTDAMEFFAALPGATLGAAVAQLMRA